VEVRGASREASLFTELKLAARRCSSGSDRLPLGRQVDAVVQDDEDGEYHWSSTLRQPALDFGSLIAICAHTIVRIHDIDGKGERPIFNSQELKGFDYARRFRVYWSTKELGYSCSICPVSSRALRWVEDVVDKSSVLPRLRT
jgi:hypothetical protein